MMCVAAWCNVQLISISQSFVFAGLSKAGMIGSVVAGIILIIALTLLVTWISYKIHKRRKRRKAALKEQPSLGFLTSSPLMSGHSHGSQNQNGKGVHSGVLELEAYALHTYGIAMLQLRMQCSMLQWHDCIVCNSMLGKTGSAHRHGQ